MSLIKYDNFYNDPFSEMDRWFAQAFGNLGGNRLNVRNQFPVDVYADDESVVVVAELPGFDKKDIQLDLQNAVLTIRATRKAKEGGEEHSYHFSRAVTVGDEIDEAKVKARFENGLLQVTLPKAESRKPRSIKIA